MEGDESQEASTNNAPDPEMPADVADEVTSQRSAGSTHPYHSMHASDNLLSHSCTYRDQHVRIPWRLLCGEKPPSPRNNCLTKPGFFPLIHPHDSSASSLCRTPSRHNYTTLLRRDVRMIRNALSQPRPVRSCGIWNSTLSILSTPSILSAWCSTLGTLSGTAH